MPSFFPKISYEQLVTVTKFTGGAAALVVVALLVSGFNGSRFAATLNCSSGSCTSVTSGDSNLTIMADPGSITSGQSTTIKWEALGVTDTLPPIACFGNLAGCGATEYSLLAANYAYAVEPFTQGANTFVFVANQTNTTQGYLSSVIYKWNNLAGISGPTGGFGGSGGGSGAGNQHTGGNYGGGGGGATSVSENGYMGAKGALFLTYTSTGGSQKSILLTTSNATYQLPNDWTNTNTIEVIGGGGGGGRGNGSNNGGGGGGGAYTKIVNTTALTGGSTYKFTVGAGGNGGGTGGNASVGGDTYFCNSTASCTAITDSAVIVGAKGGGLGGAANNAGGVGGSSASAKVTGSGSVATSGGTGSNGGGGGAAGPNGNGLNASGQTGGNGDNNYGGIGGQGTGNDGSPGQEWTVAYQSVAPYTKDFKTFTAGGNTYYSALDTTGNIDTWKWTTGGTIEPCKTTGGLGNGGTLCATATSTAAYQQGRTSTSANNLEIFTPYGTTSVFAIVANASAQSEIYKWVSTGTGCGATGGWGKDGACSTPYSGFFGTDNPFQSGFGASSNAQWKPFTIGTVTYIVDANTVSGGSVQILKWMPLGNSNKGCFGNGTTCGTNLQAGFVFSGGAHSSVDIYQDGTNTFVTFFDANGAGGTKATMFKWTVGGTGCPATTGGMGDGTNCLVASTPQSYQTFTISPASGFYTGRSFAVGSDEYLAIGGNSSGNNLIYKWTASGTNCPNSGASPGWGNGSDCASSGGTGTRSFQKIPVASMVARWGVLNSGADTYLFEANNNSTIPLPIFQAVSSSCYGDGSACGSAYQGISSSTSYNATEWEGFTTGGNSYVAQIDKTGSYSKLFKWMTSCGTNGGLGNGTTCGSTLQAIPTSGADAGDVFTVGGNTYLTVVGYSSNIKLLKWTTSGVAPCSTGGGFGNGSTCGSTYQSIVDGNHNPTNVHTFTNPLDSGNTYMIASNYFAYSYLFKWTASGTGCPSSGTAPGWGNGTSCATGASDVFFQQLAPDSNSAKWITFSAPGGAGFFLVSANFGANYQSVYKWSTVNSCFGNSAGTCGSTYQTVYAGGVDTGSGSASISVATSTDGTNLFVTFVSSNSTASTATADVDVYKWTASCFSGAGGLGNGTTCSATTNNQYQQFLHTNNAGAYSQAIAFIANGTTTLMLGGQSLNAQKSDLYVWTYGSGVPCSTTGGWGNGSQCAAPTIANYSDRNNYLQRITGSVNRWAPLFEQDSVGVWHDYLAAGNTGSKSNIYLYASSTASSVVIVPACTVYKNDATTGTTTFAAGDTNINGLDTDALTETTKYTLDCNTGYTPWIQVTVAPSTPTVTITNVSNAAEPSTDGSFRFTIDSAQASDLTINYTVSGSASATTSADYTALSGSAVITAGNSFVTVPITATGHDDSTFEGAETVTINVTADVAHYQGTPSATINIADDESSTSLPPGPLTVCTGTASASCNLGITPARVRAGGAVTVTWYLTGLVLGINGNASDTCTVTATAGTSNFTTQTWPQTGSTWINTSPGVSANINRQTIFTLSCTAPDGTTKTTPPATKTITIIPGFQEI